MHYIMVNRMMFGDQQWHYKSKLYFLFNMIQFKIQNGISFRGEYFQITRPKFQDNATIILQ